MYLEGLDGVPPPPFNGVRVQPMSVSPREFVANFLVYADHDVRNSDGGTGNSGYTWGITEEYFEQTTMNGRVASMMRHGACEQLQRQYSWAHLAGTESLHNGVSVFRYEDLTGLEGNRRQLDEARRLLRTLVSEDVSDEDASEIISEALGTKTNTTREHGYVGYLNTFKKEAWAAFEQSNCSKVVTDLGYDL